MYDFARASRVFVDFTLGFEPDALVNPDIGTVLGRVFDLLDYRPYSLPGHGVSKSSYVQNNEREWMTAAVLCDVREANVRAMIQAARDFGPYRWGSPAAPATSLPKAVRIRRRPPRTRRSSS
jgi:hypothetical protein